MKWIEKNNKLTKEFNFSDFSQAFAFMTQVAIAAEKSNHHPTWKNTYSKVEFELSTHDKGDIVTSKDKSLAEEIDKIAKNYAKA